MSKLPKHGSLETLCYIIDIDTQTAKVTIYLTEFDLIIRTSILSHSLLPFVKITEGNSIELDINGGTVTIPLMKEIPVRLTGLETEIRLSRKIHATFPIISSAALS